MKVKYPFEGMAIEITNLLVKNKDTDRMDREKKLLESRDKEIRSEEENQNTEWKWSWNDEFLKWLSGYANMDGGILYVGVNDDGYVVGLKDSRMLLESLPNKINDKLGIVASVKIYHADRLGVNIK